MAVVKTFNTHDQLHISAWLLNALRQTGLDGKPLLGQSLIIRALAQDLWEGQN